jgi:Uncharacterized conserved protein (DUF2190)
MAVESPLMRDGSNWVANANLFNPGSALSGPGGSGQFLAVTPTADGVCGISSASTQFCLGILQNMPIAVNEPCDIGIFGVSKAVSGAAITVNTPLMVDSSGRVITYVSSGGNYCIGYAMDGATGAGVVISIFVFGPGLKNAI